MALYTYSDPRLTDSSLFHCLLCSWYAAPLKNQTAHSRATTSACCLNAGAELNKPGCLNADRGDKIISCLMFSRGESCLSMSELVDVMCGSKDIFRSINFFFFFAG